MKPRIKLAIWKIRKDKTIRITKRKKNLKKNENNIRSLWDNFKQTNIHIIIGVPEKRRGARVENIFEKIMMENFPNLVKDIDIQVQKVQNPKQGEPKEAHIKTHHNESGKH